MFLLRGLGRIFRRIVANTLLALVRGRRIIFAALVVVGVAWIAMTNLNRLPIPAGMLSSILPSGGASSATSGANVADVRTTRSGVAGEPVSSVDSYIKGLTNFDAKMMWATLSEDAITSMKARGGSLEALQSGLDDAKRRGAKYEDITMIGNYPLQDGRKYLFYVLTRRGFGQAVDQLEQVYFVFTVSRDGKITRIE